MTKFGTDSTKHRHYVNGRCYGDGLGCMGFNGIGAGLGHAKPNPRYGSRFGNGGSGLELGTYEDRPDATWRKL